MARKVRELPVIGWREWVALPQLGIPLIKAKIDTGARSSAVHAFDVERFQQDGEDWVRFVVHPIQRDALATVRVEARLIDERWVRSSSGKEELRPVIQTDAELMGIRFSIELTLARRDVMGFRMLLGRQAVRDRYLIDPGHSYRAGKPSKTVGEIRNV